MSRQKFSETIQNLLFHPVLYFTEIRHMEEQFDREWYVASYPESLNGWDTPIAHYCVKGWKEGKDPTGDFSTTSYLRSYADVVRDGMNPFVHYLRYGSKEGRTALAANSVCEDLFAQAKDFFDGQAMPKGDKWLSLIVPVYNAPERYLDELLESFRTQGPCGVQLILSDDGSPRSATREWLERHTSEANVTIVLNETNGGISAASNAALETVETPWLAFLDHDDALAPYALRVVKHTIDNNPSIKFAYTDEATVDQSLQIAGLMLKPAFDPVLLSGVNYINHFSVYQTDRVRAVGGLRSAFDGSQDYDLLLRYLDGIDDAEVAHIPYPAYLWRLSEQSFSQVYSEKSMLNARAALQEVYGKQQSVSVGAANVKDLHKVTFERADDAWPLISIIIPNKNCPSLMKTILKGIFEKTDYPNIEVLVIDNGSNDNKTLKLYNSYSQRDNFQAHIEEGEFNFSYSVNRGLKLANGEHYLLLNNDIEILHADWLKEMVSCLSFEKAGIVGAKLLYPNKTVQHAGVIVGIGGLAAHWFMESEDEYGGPMNRLHVRNSMTCVTGAAMLISGACLKATGYYDDERFKVAYNDVDFSIRAYKQGYRTIWTPFAKLIHHESVSRGSDEAPENNERFERERFALQSIHKTKGYVDPAYHPVFSWQWSHPQLLKSDLSIQPRFWFG